MAAARRGRVVFNMGRPLGPKHHMCRRIGQRLCSSDKCPVLKRPTPPGVHGPKGYGRQTEYGTQLREKQKVKYVYGVMERQFRRYYKEAIRREGNTAELFLQQLERRLDNVVFRLGFARSRMEARQMVNHGWIRVNGKRVDIPSYQVRAGEVITLKPGVENSTRIKAVASAHQGQTAPSPSWLSRDQAKFEGKIASLPSKTDFPANLNMTLVVEFYSR